ncbi:MAG: DUF4856 domain-containing protein, partial [Myxococcales bacterium]|nr:DUF4856 domain-containing protein [Myxococcales bacterium]
GCGDDDGPGPDLDGGLPVEDGSTPVDASTDAGPGCEATPNAATYAFESRFEGGKSSVDASGQIARHVLIQELVDSIDALTAELDANKLATIEDGDIVERLDFYYHFDSDESGDVKVGLTATPPLLQRYMSDISTGKDLAAKFVGNDTSTDFKDWSTEFRGWSDDTIAANGGDVSTPEGLLTAFFETIEEQALAYQQGSPAEDPEGNELPVHVTASGLNLKELTQKLLLVGITFHQAADDYLDDDKEGSGILASNDGPSAEGSPYTSLEHAWDEGFGYFGAARDYGDYSDDELASADGRADWQGHHDTNDDGATDLLTEYNFGFSTNAAKRDRGAQDKTDFTKELWSAFIAGRHLIATAGAEPSKERLDAIRKERNRAILAWEKVIAATVLHYVNDTLQAMELFTSDDYSFEDHAKAWSEMKAFALGLQFSPRSPLSDDDFETFHQLVGDAPVLS